MRIVSEFRDYYDCIQAMGQDRSLVYVKISKEVDCSYRGVNSPVYPFPTFGGYYRFPYDDFSIPTWRSKRFRCIWED